MTDQPTTPCDLEGLERLLADEARIAEIRGLRAALAQTADTIERRHGNLNARDIVALTAAHAALKAAGTSDPGLGGIAATEPETQQDPPRRRGSCHREEVMTIEVGKPMPYFCPACQSIPSAGFCNLAGCPTAPAAEGSATTTASPSRPQMAEQGALIAAAKAALTFYDRADLPHMPGEVEILDALSAAIRSATGEA